MSISKRSVRASGFTVLELVLVVVVTGILGSIGTHRIMTAKDRSHIGAAQSDLMALRQALAIYSTDRGGYPASLASYEEFKDEMVDYSGRPVMVLPSGQTFRWVSYVVHREGSYVLVIQALDHNQTTIVATEDTIEIG